MPVEQPLPALDAHDQHQRAQRYRSSPEQVGVRVGVAVSQMHHIIIVG